MAKVCPECGTKYRDTDKSCSKCRTNLVTLRDKDPLIGRVIEDRFTITDKIGAGGMGSVYRARQHSLNKDVALKILKADLSENLQSIRRFLREAKASSQLDHPNTIRVFDFGQTEDGLLFIAMELLKGRSLSRLLQDENCMGLDRAVHIISQICDSLTEAHGLGIIHRDLKPDNVYLVETAGNPDFVKVLDFGIAKMVMGNESGSLTHTGQVFGTPHYMSPEQADGQELDTRSDIYSLGAILFEMLTGNRPFTGETPVALLIKIKTEPAPLLHEANSEAKFPQDLETFVNRILSKEPGDRPQTVQEVKAFLLNAREQALSGRVVRKQKAPEKEPEEIISPTVVISPPAQQAKKIIQEEKPELSQTYMEKMIRKPKKLTGYLNIAGILFLVVGLGIIGALIFSGERKNEEETQAPAASPVVPVKPSEFPKPEKIQVQHENMPKPEPKIIVPTQEPAKAPAIQTASEKNEPLPVPAKTVQKTGNKKKTSSETRTVKEKKPGPKPKPQEIDPWEKY